MALKTILIALTTTRVLAEGEKAQRVRFPAMSVVDLTQAEQNTLDALTKSTGKAHYRDPVNEGGKAVESKPDAVDTGDADGDYAEADRAIEDKTVKGLKAYLDHNEVEYPKDADKAALVKLAEARKAQDGGTGGDQDEGL